MLQIKFDPESDKKHLIIAAKEYTQIWNKEGGKIVLAIEEQSNMVFMTTAINALIFDGISYSVPLQLNYQLTIEEKRAEITHELIHRLFYDHNFWFAVPNINKEAHKTVYLLLFDIWEKLLGTDSAEANKNREINYGDPDYKEAWKWALSFTKKERAKQFQIMKLHYANKAPA